MHISACGAGASAGGHIPRIAILNLNPGLDRVIYLDGPMKPGTMNRAARTVLNQGSKAANAALMLAALGGAEVHYFSFTGGAMGDACAAFTAVEGIHAHLVETAAGVRVNTKVIDGEGVCTELNERGGPVSREELELLLREMEKSCGWGKADLLFLCGSIPQGVEKDVYKLLCTKKIAERVILDCDGEALARGIEGSPFLIKPNRRELEGLVGTALSTDEAVGAACAKLGEKYHINLLCTLDADGSIYVGEEGCWRVSAPEVPFRGFSGAGDTYLASYIWARFVDRREQAESLRFGAAAAGAKVALEGTELPGREQIEALLERVEVKAQGANNPPKER